MPPSVINLVLVIGVWLTLVVGCCDFAKRDSNNNNSGSTPGTTPSSTDVDSSALSAVDLYNEWKKDKGAADSKYKDKTLRVTGKIRLAKDTSIVLNSGEKSDILGVQCILAEKDRGRTSELREGQTLTVEGKCMGLLINVVLRPCTIQ